MKIVFWDYDGTLVDTELLYKDSIEKYFGNNNLLLKNISNEYFFEFISGKHPEDFVFKLKKDGFIKNININCEEVKKYYTIYFKNLKQGEIKIVSDVDFIIEKLSKFDDIVMCITSSSFIHDFQIKHNNVHNKILDKNFDLDKNVYLCGSIKNCHFKPAPDIFIYAFDDIIKKYNLSLTQNDELFIIEDSIAGCSAGASFKKIKNNEIKIKVVGVNIYPYKNNNELLVNGADVVVNNTNDIYSILSI
ncbi:MAG: HAD hydrolase-like protein [Rickettsiales bacterium]|nr:HAD hydrolase-like protein [Rickettsiales bacterium]